MDINSEPIKKAVAIAVSEGNSVQTIVDGWSKMKQVVTMKDKLTHAVKMRIENEVPDLRYRAVAQTPFYPATERFISDSDQVGLEFPVE